jgi:hypothetical protein
MRVRCINTGLILRAADINEPDWHFYYAITGFHLVRTKYKQLIIFKEENE